jgi:hypothetical protein
LVHPYSVAIEKNRLFDAGVRHSKMPPDADLIPQTGFLLVLTPVFDSFRLELRTRF